METQQYARRPFYVDAVQVTEENIKQVAKWCRGEIRTAKGGKRYIKVRVYRAMDEKQTMAFIGDFVLYAHTGYKVYTANAFNSTFVKATTKEEALRALHILGEGVGTVTMLEREKDGIAEAGMRGLDGDIIDPAKVLTKDPEMVYRVHRGQQIPAHNHMKDDECTETCPLFKALKFDGYYPIEYLRGKTESELEGLIGSGDISVNDARKALGLTEA